MPIEESQLSHSGFLNKVIWPHYRSAHSSKLRSFMLLQLVEADSLTLVQVDQAATYPHLPRDNVLTAFWASSSPVKFTNKINYHMCFVLRFSVSTFFLVSSPELSSLSLPPCFTQLIHTVILYDTQLLHSQGIFCYLCHLYYLCSLSFVKPF